tara:strand:+ start:11 stop:232 length:222 start_codon:yes stop_codon:yes gene_type:complete
MEQLQLQLRHQVIQLQLELVELEFKELLVILVLLQHFHPLIQLAVAEAVQEHLLLVLLEMVLTEGLVVEEVMV